MKRLIAIAGLALLTACTVPPAVGNLVADTPTTDACASATATAESAQNAASSAANQAQAAPADHIADADRAAAVAFGDAAIAREYASSTCTP